MIKSAIPGRVEAIVRRLPGAPDECKGLTRRQHRHAAKLALEAYNTITDKGRDTFGRYWMWILHKWHVKHANH